MLLGNRHVAMYTTPAIDGLQTSPEAVLGRLSRERPSAFPRDSPIVRESQEVEGARWLESVGVILPGPPAICRLAETDETTFLRVHREGIVKLTKTRLTAPPKMMGSGLS